MQVKVRRSFSQRNLGQKHRGPDGPALLHALQVPEEDGYVGMHAFHPYPGRFHPLLVRRVLELPSNQGPRRVLDPFMGCGTTLLEARRLGHEIVGNDLNPLSLRLTEMKLLQLSTTERIHLRRTLIDISQCAGEHEGWVDHPRLVELRALYRPHTLAEMLHLWAVIQELEGVERLVAEMLLSACCVKFSTLACDSQARVQEKAPHPKGAVFRWWADRTKALIIALEEEAKQSPRVPTTLREGDMLSLVDLSGTADLILTSPPYPGTYDYAEHHHLRALWLELPMEEFYDREIGARRQSIEEWEEQGLHMLAGLEQLLAAEGRIYLVIGDWLGSQGPCEALKWIASAAEEVDLTLGSSASVVRASHFSVGRSTWDTPRWEHLIELAR